MPRLIFHVDVNSAFLSWEAVFRLRYLNSDVDLRTIPSAVGGDRESRRGIILAKSTPAKKYGIQTAEPIVDALRKCPELVIVPGRWDYYEECSHAFMDILREYSELVKAMSIDEACVDLTENSEAVKDPVGFADMLRARIRDELGFTVNIGISENILLAKMASDFTKPDRTHTLFPSEVPTKMWPLPVRDLMFIGASTATALRSLGINTIGELAAADDGLLKTYFGKGGPGMKLSAQGIDDTPVTLEHSELKGYGNSTTLPANTTDRDEAHRVLLMLSESVGIRMRRDHSYISVISVSIRDGSFDKQSHQMKLKSCTDITSEIYDHACKLFDSMWDGRPIRALGVHTSGVTKEDTRQLDLFDTTDYERQEKADKLMDELRSRFGSDSVKRASLIRKKD